MPTVLIVDADGAQRALLASCCEEAGLDWLAASGLADARLLLARQRPAAMLLELALPDGSGLALLQELQCAAPPGVPAARPACAVLARQPTLESAVAALRLGARDYLPRPLDIARVQHFLAHLPRPVPLARAALEGAFHRMAGASPVMLGLYRHIARVAPTEATVFLLGESGTGKELVAQTVHELSQRRRAPFLPVNCGAISPHLIESEIFGHEKGSFTGAERQHKGYFERAHGGTLFLDEITEMPADLQVKLLRVLESGSFMRIGSHQEVETDVRIVAASNRDPEQAIVEGKLRLDLYHRLNVFPLAVPPLRERGADIALLARLFLAELNAAHGSAKAFTDDALAALAAHAWPGNVRELRNAVQRAFIMADRSIGADGLAPASAPAADTSHTLSIALGTSLAEADRRLIFATLERCGGVKKRAAQVLGISLKTLYNRLEEYGGLPPAAVPAEGQAA